jgi:hypothetical protein
MSGSKGYMRDLLGPEGCRNVNWISPSFTCNTHTSHHFLSYLQVTDPLMSSIWYSSSYKCTICVVLNTFASENTFVLTWFLEAGMTVYFLSTWKCSSSPQPLFEHHCFFAVVFNNTLLKGD